MAAWSIQITPARIAGPASSSSARIWFSPTAARTNTGRRRVTYGGYSESIVVDERFVLRIPPNLDLARVAPLLCAGITTYSPMRHWNVANGKKVGVVGLGGVRARDRALPVAFMSK